MVEQAIAWEKAGKREVVSESVRKVKPLVAVHEFEIACMLCGQRVSARGTEDDAVVTSQRLAGRKCGRCGGGLRVERSDVGSIGSPVHGHSPLYDSQKAGVRRSVGV